MDHYWEGNCLYPPKLGTFTSCFEESGLDFNNSINTFLKICLLFGNVEVSESQLYETHTNASKYLIELTDPSVVLYQPTKPSYTLLMDFTKLYGNYFNSVNRATEFGNLTIKYWLIALAVVTLANWIKSTRINTYLRNKPINKFRAFFTIPTFTKKHLSPYNLLICETLLPTIQEFYLLIIYFAICIYGSSTDYFVYANNALFKDEYTQWVRFVADRTGIISFTQLPLLFLFGGRNNLLINLTGLPYNTFIIFHKWISRMMFSCALVHGICYTLYAVHYNSLIHDFKQQYWIFGCIAISACFGIMVQAIYRFRKICYEYFLIIHIVLLAVFIFACIVHCWRFGWLQYCFLSVAVWALDRIIRISKMYRFGFSKLDLEILSTVDPTFKISVRKPAGYKTFPGCYVFIHILDWRFKFWESHPFTIYELDECINIIIKPKAGMTLKLYNHLLTSKDQKCQLRVGIEGPYGHHVPKKYYDQVVLLAGGNGIPGPFYHALSSLDKVDNESRVNKVKLCWVIRDLESLNWFYKELQLILNKVDIEIYVTREKLPSVHYGSVDSTQQKRINSRYNSLKEQNIVFYDQRPSFYKNLKNEVLNRDLKSLNVVSCGNPLMCDEIRNVVGELVEELDSVRIDLFEELQIW